MEMRCGNIPKSANAEILDDPESGWVLYRLAGSNADWLSLKLVHIGPIAGAANYWLGWSVKDKRLSRVKDTERLALHQPELHRWVVRIMSELYPTLKEEYMTLLERA